MGALQPRVCLLNTRTPWNEPPRARHQLAEALAERSRVYFVSANREGSPRLEQFDAKHNLTVLMPQWPIHHRWRYRFPVVNEIYQRWLFSGLRALVYPDVVINFDHTATQLFRYFSGVVYYCNDYHIRNDAIAPIRAYFERCEQSVATHSKLCIATCEYLRDRLGQWNSRSYEVRLGAPRVDWRPGPRCRDGRIKVVLVGYLDERRSSIEILERLAADPNLELTVYGPVGPGAKRRLELMNDIRLGGVVTGQDLLRELDQFDVGIAPYRIDDGNIGRTPNKLWLYLASGTPCVVTDIPAIRQWTMEEGFMYRANGPEQFRDRIYEAAAADNPALARRRYEFSQANTWRHRADEVLRLLERHKD